MSCLILLAWVGIAEAENAVSSNAPPSKMPGYTLWQTLNLALKQNSDVLIAKKKLEEAAGAIVEARAGFLPSVSTYDNYQRFQSEYATLNGVMTNNRPFLWNVSVRVTETAFAGGAVINRMRIAKLNKQSRMLDYQATVNRVIMDVRIAFYDILRSQSDINVHQRAVDFLQRQAEYEQQRLQVGTGQKLNAMRANVELSLEQAALIEAQNAFRNASLHLGELLNIPSGQAGMPFTVQGQLEILPSAFSEEQCVVNAMEHRPELQVSENEIEVQKKQYIIDRSAILPHVNLFAGYDWISEPDRALPQSYYDGYTMGVGVSWNIFDGFAAKGRMRETHARMEEAEIAESALKNGIRAEVARAFHDLQRALDTVQSQRENMDLAAQSLSLAQANFEQGLITQLDLLQSRLDLTRAQSVELNARFDYNSAMARLERAMGAEFEVTNKEAK
ncbi:MAG TPA: TolC family protein [Verrucomicrobiae bacterium]|nr:TolC family protein [Verrucomicrobiae bacterium]